MGQEFKMCINRETNRRRPIPVRIINDGWFKNSPWTVLDNQPKGPDKTQSAQKPQKQPETKLAPETVEQLSKTLPEEKLIEVQPEAKEEEFVPPAEGTVDVGYIQGDELRDYYKHVIGKKAHHKAGEDKLRTAINAKLNETE